MSLRALSVTQCGAAIRSLSREKRTLRATIANRSFLTHSVISAASIDALRKVYSVIIGGGTSRICTTMRCKEKAPRT
jgi:Flp pilus assembly CpaF family ATPase